MDGYPLDEYKDSVLIKTAMELFPGIDILAELEKKIDWWRKNPDALREEVGPRQQLFKWIEKEHVYQMKRAGR